MEFEKILEKIRPTEKEHLKMGDIQYMVCWILSEQFSNAIIEPVGSFVKGTDLSGTSDLDIFVKFPLDYPADNFKTIVHKKIKSALESIGATTETNYASHPYVRGKIGGIDIDVAPCYDVEKGEVISAVDRTPHHSKFIQEHLQEHQKDEVRLLKQFLKAHEIYGANEKYRGFSGYLCELLIYAYGSFLKVLQGELQNYRQNDPHIPINFIDPTDAKRNVAAALSWETFNDFIFVSRCFLDDYKTQMDKSELDIYFDIPEDQLVTKEDVAFIAEQRGTKGYWIEYQSKTDNEEVLYSTARKYLKKIVQLCEQHDFKVFESDYQVDGRKVVFILEFEYDKLSNYKKVKGPSIDIPKESFLNWVDSHNSVFVQDKDFYTHIEREYTNVYDLLKNYVNLSIEKVIYD